MIKIDLKRFVADFINARAWFGWERLGWKWYGKTVRTGEGEYHWAKSVPKQYYWKIVTVERVNNEWFDNL